MIVEVLNNFTGDNNVELDTTTDDGKKKAVETFMSLLRSGTAIFLERAGETYRVTGYDPATDSLKVEVPVPEARRGGRKLATKAKPRVSRGDRVTAVAPRAGG